MFLPIKSHAFITSSPKIRWQTKNISTTTGPMATILGWMVTYLDGLLLIKFHNFDQMAFQDTWGTTTIVSLLQQCLSPPNLAGWWLTLRGSAPKVYATLWSRGFARSRDKLEPLYHHYDSTYDHQTWQDGGLSWGTPTEVTWHFDQGYCKIMSETKAITSSQPKCL